MRKSLVVLLPLAILALVAVAIQAEEGTKWVDPQNCYFCKPLAETPGLMEHVGWENHKIKSGMVSVTTYTPEWKEKYKAASAEMQKRWSTMDPKQTYQMCGMCQAWMKVPMDKVSWETVEFTGGELGITTTSDSAVVPQLHAICDKTCPAMDEMMKAEAAPKQ